MASALHLEIHGLDDLAKKLARMDDSLEKTAIKDITKGTLKVHGTAVKSIQAHLSRNTQAGTKRGNKTHFPSLPGFPPNTDTGNLVKQIRFEFTNGGFTGLVGTNVKYGANLEFGTSKMKPRPWLGPAYLKHRKDILKNMTVDLKSTINKEARK